jgi:hypothetical protein
MDDNSTNDGADGHHHHQAEEEEEEEEEEWDDPHEQYELKVISTLQRKKQFPTRTRDKINELVDNFLERLEVDIHCMLCSKYDDIDEHEDEDEYYGLDNNHDTEAEVEAAIRLFPHVLSTVWSVRYIGEYEYRKYPIQLLAFSRITPTLGCNWKAVSFLPLVVRLAIEFGKFEEQERGGLLCQNNSDTNALLDLMKSNHTPPERHNQEDRELLGDLVDDIDLQVLIQRRQIVHLQNNQIIDLIFLLVLMKLRQMGLFKKEDIQRYGLLNRLCCYSFFALNRFRFLVAGDPSALIHPDELGCLPLHEAADNTSIQGFKMVFEYGIRYYPKKKGISILFKKDSNGDTPFQRACERFGYEEVMKIVYDTLTRYSDTTPINVEEALIMAAIDENIHLDCLYFLLRRQPDVLVKLLSSQSSPPSTSTVSVVSTSNNDNNINNRDSSSKKGRKRDRNSNGTYRCRQKTPITTRQQQRQKSTR